MKRSKKALSIIVMLLMVAMTLAPTWAFGTEAAPAAQSGAQESQAAAVETSGAAEPILQSSPSRHISMQQVIPQSR